MGGKEDGGARRFVRLRERRRQERQRQRQQQGRTAAMERPARADTHHRQEFGAAAARDMDHF